jgi:hypothetical protein
MFKWDNGYTLNLNQKRLIDLEKSVIDPDTFDVILLPYLY